ncbi:MAG: hypothetical protein V3S16_14185 [Candidatus Desulfatibia sp.]|uniref:hypothetical protein n=1 Tax=Candidatus Desulfatibia sp. TaxID=3101189 RepID=UPI002F34EEF7
MKTLTTGMINDGMVSTFFECLLDCEGCSTEARKLANNVYCLNAAATTEEADSWYEALAQFKKIN